MKCKWMEKICKNERMRESLLAGLLLLVAIVILILGIVKTRQSKIASVDMDKILRTHPVMQEAITNFQAEMSEMEKQFEKMKDEDKIKNQQKLQQEISEIAMRFQNEAMEKVIKDIERIARKKGYNCVMDKNAVIVGGDNITDEILAVIEQKDGEEAKHEHIDASEMPMIPIE